MSQRTDRIDELLQQEIGALLAKEIADPRIGFVTITDIETSPDLRHARVWVSVIGQPGERDEAIRALQQSMGYVRHELGRRLRLKRIPELHVRLDDSAERGTRVLKLIDELEAGATPDVDATPTESLPTPVARLPHEGDVPEVAPEWATPPAGQPRRHPRSGRRGGRHAPRGGTRKR
ncbi:MAG TPA: 30S ribosome-binding factor RbfA [Candidatus Limnocylindrales bacterium]|nr:30S ribosome-binding factor RbfA [Candidatus Limnocylindrales bacterium]